MVLVQDCSVCFWTRMRIVLARILVLGYRMGVSNKAKALCVFQAVMWPSNNGIVNASYFPNFGGNWNSSTYAGIFNLNVNNSATNTNSNIGARISTKYLQSTWTTRPHDHASWQKIKTTPPTSPSPPLSPSPYTSLYTTS